MKNNHLHAIADAAYGLLYAAELAEALPDHPMTQLQYQHARDHMLSVLLPVYTLEQIKDFAIDAAVDAHGGSKTLAADALGISRRCVYNRLERRSA